jgi:hypothetical protein
MRSPTDKEVWQLAAHLIERYGVDAAAAAEERARDALASDDDVMGHGIWLAIAAAWSPGRSQTHGQADARQRSAGVSQAPVPGDDGQPPRSSGRAQSSRPAVCGDAAG